MSSDDLAPIRVAPRQSWDVDSVIKLFEATHIVNGYPVDSPPQWNAASWPAFVSSDDEVVNLVALQEVPPALLDKEKEDILPPTNGQRMILGHVSLRRAHNDELGAKLHVPVEDIWKVSKFAVHPSVQGRGIGSLIMQTVEDLAKEEGKTLVLGVLEKDAAAVRMYQKRGWKMFGTGVMVGMDGRRWPEHFYCLYADRNDGAKEAHQ